ncbi:MAG: deoxyribodipyrimidine photolyase, partial [Actinobacteria bacterium]|nr:deoxyribodipyrimidine photolyase [Actinomycetota bacterium]
MSRIIYVPFDQLNSSCGALRDADKARDHIVLIESQRMVHGRPWHRQRLHFLLSSARHFAAELQAAGWRVTYLKSPTTLGGLQSVLAAEPAAELICAEPSSWRTTEQLRSIGATFVANDFFLTPRPLFAQWAAAQKQFTMENFYRAQRRRLGILMDGDGPVGGAWNYDAENRLPPPKEHDWGPTLQWVFDDIDEQVAAELPETAWGELTTKTWGTTRVEALAQLAHFMEHHFHAFGPYEDAMPRDSWSGHHSLLSPYLNNGLLLASEVVDAALERFRAGGIPLASCEGFIRQIIGWREYVNGMYWFLGQDYRDRNHLGAIRALLPLFHDPAATQMNCVRCVVSDVQARGWTHH